MIPGSIVLFWGEGGGGLVQSPGSRVLSPGSRVQGSLHLLGYADPTVIVKCWNVAYWDAKKLLKKLPKSKKWLLKFQKLLPKVLHIFIQYIVKQWIVFFARSNWLLNP